MISRFVSWGAIRVGLLLAGLALLLVGLLDSINFTVDDTFIFFRYAENFAAGNGLVFNPGERTEGYSSVLWTLMLGAFAKAGFNQDASPIALLRAAKLAGAAFALATIVVQVWIVERVRRERPWGEASDLIALAVICTTATYSFPAWSVSGLETPMCAFLVTVAGAFMMAGLYRFQKGASPTGPLLAAGAVFGLLTLVRPEQVFIWALAFAAFTWVAPARLRPALLRSALVTAVLFAGLLVWRWTYYHDVIPNSVTAKMGGGLMTLILSTKYTLGGLAAILGTVALGFLGLPQLLRGRLEWQFLAVYFGAYLAFVLVSGGDWMPGFRFFVPVLPLLWVLAIGSLLSFTSMVKPPVSAVVLCGLVVVVAVSSFAAGRALVRAQYGFPTGIKRITWQPSPTRQWVAQEIQRIVPAGSLLATFEAGYVPYYNRNLRILDTSGLSDREIARLPGRHMYKMTPETFLRRNPDYYVMMVAGGRPSADGARLLASPDFVSRYDVMKRFDSFDFAMASLQESDDPANVEDMGFVLYRRK